MRRFEVDWGHLGFLAVIAAAVIWYLADAVSVSTAVNNLLLVAPVGGFALLLCALVARQCVRTRGVAAHAGREDVIGVLRPAQGRDALRIAAVALALVLLVLVVTFVGFDLGILLFCGAVMWICGERRPLLLLAYPVAVTLAVVLGFRAILPFPMPTLLL